ncbi:SulP family inorganic anion transporter [Kurthia massiliensis]|uniref:SulP family inorganic anion transporter n=1 Tax=Kurthia massiliensis TaxID=1033739 RepID=UPI000289AF28|nr:sulfate permease [Kurthia massiliensis]
MQQLFLNRFKDYTLQSFQKDVIAGIIVGIVAIPLAMSFAIASGVKPEYGIYTSCIAGILIALFGGSKFQIGGPTGAFVPILLGVVIVYGYEDLLLAGLMAGVMLCLMSFFKLGGLIKFIPKPVIIGFTAGIGVIIFTGQIANFLGITGLEKHESLVLNMKEIILHIQQINTINVFIALISFAAIILTTKFAPKIPATLVGIIVSTVVAVIFFKDQLPTIGSVYGAIPSELPSFVVPEITAERIQHLIGPAIVIALLGAIESLLSAVVADEMTKTKHHSNRELFGQGIANIVTPFFGGIPATGAIARTATNVRSGAVSPVSAIVHGIFVVIVLIAFAPYASAIPLASMAPILMIVAWNMSERKHFTRIVKMKNGDALVLVVTFLLTVFTSLTTAVAVGIGLGIILFTKRMSSAVAISKMLPDHTSKFERVSATVVEEMHNCPQVSIYTMEGPLFFMATQKFEKQMLAAMREKQEVIILRMSKVPFIDISGESTLNEILEYAQAHNIQILFSGISKSLSKQFDEMELRSLIGEECIFEHTGDAIQAALTYVKVEKCKDCQQAAFHECDQFVRA